MANDPVILIEGKDKPESFNNHKDHSRMVAYFQQGQMAESNVKFTNQSNQLSSVFFKWITLHKFMSSLNKTNASMLLSNFDFCFKCLLAKHASHRMYFTPGNFDIITFYVLMIF